MPVTGFDRKARRRGVPVLGLPVGLGATTQDVYAAVPATKLLMVVS